MRTMILAVLMVIATFNIAEARRRGPCDGIHRCTCGSTQARHFKLPRFYKGHNLWRAVEWKRAFPRASLAPGVVVYQRGGGPSGHVSRVVRVISRCRAIVADERGTYERNVCSRGAVYVRPR